MPGGGRGRRSGYASRVAALLQAIPNLSEARRAGVVERLAAAASGVPGAHLLDRSSDSDHNRTVLTLAGEAEALIAALTALFEVAVAEIDLGGHGGVHPRVGAVDVVPFVPLRETPMAAAVAAARTLAERVAERFELPVFLYEEAAAVPGRRLLPDLRRGGLEGLAERIGSPGWEPDLGPPRLHPTAGASVIGARTFLIAFNAVLDTGDLETARRIARAVREASGGLEALRAIGVSLESRGRMQVSMNLVDPRRTSMAAALAAVEAEAGRRGARVVETEVVGLVPEAAVTGELGADRVLEHRLDAVGL